MKKILPCFLAVIVLCASLSAIAGVELNTATFEELESLHGVGPVRALEIIKYREQNGGFKSIDELKNIKGIGDASFEAIKKDLSVWDPYWSSSK